MKRLRLKREQLKDREKRISAGEAAKEGSEKPGNDELGRGNIFSFSEENSHNSLFLR